MTSSTNPVPAVLDVKTFKERALEGGTITIQSDGYAPQVAQAWAVLHTQRVNLTVTEALLELHRRDAIDALQVANEVQLELGDQMQLSDAWGPERMRHDPKPKS